jgi:hypothetical protein
MSRCRISGCRSYDRRHSPGLVVVDPRNDLHPHLMKKQVISLDSPISTTSLRHDAHGEPHTVARRRPRRSYGICRRVWCDRMGNDVWFAIGRAEHQPGSGRSPFVPDVHRGARGSTSSPSKGTLTRRTAAPIRLNLRLAATEVRSSRAGTGAVPRRSGLQRAASTSSATDTSVHSAVRRSNSGGAETSHPRAHIGGTL